MLPTIPTYNPNTKELKTTSLNTYYTALIATTQKGDQTESHLNTKLIERNTILYAKDTGLYTIAQNVKKYVKSLYGATAAEYTRIQKIKSTSFIT